MPFAGSQFANGIVRGAGAGKQFAAGEVQFNGRRTAGTVAEIETPRTIAARVLIPAPKVKSHIQNFGARRRPRGGERQAEAVVFTAVGHLHAELASGMDIAKGTL